LLKRGDRVRKYLRDEREEKNIVCVFHGSFVHYVTQNVDKDGEKVGEYT